MRVGAEEDAGHVGRDEFLHDNRHGDLVDVDAMFGEVGAGARAVEAGPAALDCVEQAIFGGDVEECFILAGHGGLGHVFGRGAGADGDAPAAQGAIGLADLLAQAVDALTQIVAACVAITFGGDDKAAGDGEAGADEHAEINGLAAGDGLVATFRKQLQDMRAGVHCATFPPIKQRRPPVSLPTNTRPPAMMGELKQPTGVSCPGSFNE